MPLRFDLIYTEDFFCKSRHIRSIFDKYPGCFSAQRKKLNNLFDMN